MTSPSPIKRKRLVKTIALKRKSDNTLDTETKKQKPSSSETHNTENSSDDSEQVCTICLSTVSYPKAVPNHCKHQFCNKCICLWKERSNLCPVCRSRFTSLKVFDKKESKTFKVVTVKKKDFEIDYNELVNGFYRNENSDEEEAEEYRYYPNDHDNSDEEEEDDANASDADEHGNLAGFVIEELDRKLADDESFVLDEEDLEEEDYELSQISLVDESEIHHTPEKSFINLTTPITHRKNNIIYIDSTPLRPVEIDDVSSDDDDDVTEVLDPNEVSEIIEIL